MGNRLQRFASYAFRTEMGHLAGSTSQHTSAKNGACLACKHNMLLVNGDVCQGRHVLCDGDIVNAKRCCVSIVGVDERYRDAGRPTNDPVIALFVGSKKLKRSMCWTNRYVQNQRTRR